MSFTEDKETDNYTTYKTDWERIKEYIPTDKKIWSPFYCDGKQKEYFKEMGYDIIHEDEDFFKSNKGEIIIDNPPFGKIKKICVRLKKLEKPFILIMPNHTFLYKRFQRPFHEHLQLIIPNKRLKFDKDNIKSNLPFDCYYFCYKMNLEKDLIFL